MTTSHITLEYYGRLSAARGINQEKLPSNEFNKISQIFDYIDNMNISLTGCVAAINDEIVTPDRAIKPGDTVALLPPVSGG